MGPDVGDDFWPDRQDTTLRLLLSASRHGLHWGSSVRFVLNDRSPFQLEPGEKRAHHTQGRTQI